MFDLRHTILIEPEEGFADVLVPVVVEATEDGLAVGKEGSVAVCGAGHAVSCIEFEWKFVVLGPHQGDRLGQVATEEHIVTVSVDEVLVGDVVEAVEVIVGIGI